MTNPDLRPQYGAEAQQIVDRISMIRSIPQMFLLRAWATNGVNSAALMESIGRYSLIVLQNQNNIDDGLRNLYRNGINSLRKMIEALANDSSIDRHRYQEVLNVYNQASHIVL